MVELKGNVTPMPAPPHGDGGCKFAADFRALHPGDGHGADRRGHRRSDVGDGAEDPGGEGGGVDGAAAQAAEQGVEDAQELVEDGGSGEQVTHEHEGESGEGDLLLHRLCEPGPHGVADVAAREQAGDQEADDQGLADVALEDGVPHDDGRYVAAQCPDSGHDAPPGMTAAAAARMSARRLASSASTSRAAARTSAARSAGTIATPSPSAATRSPGRQTTPPTAT